MIPLCAFYHPSAASGMLALLDKLATRRGG
jgi:hypothetical protein